MTLVICSVDMFVGSLVSSVIVIFSKKVDLFFVEGIISHIWRSLLASSAAPGVCRLLPPLSPSGLTHAPRRRCERSQDKEGRPPGWQAPQGLRHGLRHAP
mgnify:CR=1 FL=1